MEELLFRWLSFSTKLRFCFLIGFLTPIEYRTFSISSWKPGCMDEVIEEGEVSLRFIFEVGTSDDRLVLPGILSIEVPITRYHELYSCHHFFRTGIFIVCYMDTLKTSLWTRKIGEFIFYLLDDLFAPIDYISVELGFDRVTR